MKRTMKAQKRFIGEYNEYDKFMLYTFDPSFSYVFVMTQNHTTPLFPMTLCVVTQKQSRSKRI